MKFVIGLKIQENVEQDWNKKENKWVERGNEKEVLHFGK